VLDDRSLNGVFVNGSRIEGKVLKDGDEIIIGRYRLSFMDVQARPDMSAEGSEGSGRASLSDGG